MRCSTNIYLTALAVADIFLLLFVFIRSLEHYPNTEKYTIYWSTYGLQHWFTDAASKCCYIFVPRFICTGYLFDNENQLFSTHSTTIFFVLFSFSAYTSIYLTVSFTIERYIAVCHPIRGQVLCTESRAKRVIAGTVFWFMFLVVVCVCMCMTICVHFQYINYTRL